MNPPIARVPALGGLDLRIPAASDSCSKLTNWTVDRQTGGWDNRIGWEKYFPREALFAPFATDGRVDSVFFWVRHGGAMETLLYEEGGTLSYINQHTSVPSRQTIAAGRTEPGPAGVSSVFVPAGPDLVIFGGGQAPLRYREGPAMDASPDPRVFQFGWSAP